MSIVWVRNNTGYSRKFVAESISKAGVKTVKSLFLTSYAADMTGNTVSTNVVSADKEVVDFVMANCRIFQNLVTSGNIQIMDEMPEDARSSTAKLDEMSTDNARLTAELARAKAALSKQVDPDEYEKLKKENEEFRKLNLAIDAAKPLDQSEAPAAGTGESGESGDK